MHRFEDLREEVPMFEWDYDQVYDAIKLRLKELHHLGISHNDVRPANIVVSETGKISLIDFGLSTYPTSEKRKKRDFEALDQSFRRGSYGVNEVNEDDLEGMESEAAYNENKKYGSDGKDMLNSSIEGIFDKVSKETQDTGSIKGDISSTAQWEDNENDSITSSIRRSTRILQSTLKRQV